jgi:hypothetical protein
MALAVDAPLAGAAAAARVAPLHKVVMRQVVQFLIGLYILIALIVFGGGVYGMMSGETARASPCPVPDNWLGWAAYRAIAWPKTYFDDIGKVEKLGDWYFVHYTPVPESCEKS